MHTIVNKVSRRVLRPSFKTVDKQIDAVLKTIQKQTENWGLGHLTETYMVETDVHVTLSGAEPDVTEQDVMQRHVAIPRADVNDKRSFRCLSRQFDLPSAMADGGGDLCIVWPLTCNLDGDGVALCVGSAPQNGLLRATL